VRRLAIVAVLAATVVAARAAAAAAPLAGHIAYSSRDWPRNGGDNWEIWLLKADGSERHNVSRNESCDDVGPAISHGGRQIAFVCHSLRAGNPELLSVVEIDGSGTRRIAGGGSHRLSTPAWSPDDSRLAIAVDGFVSVVDVRTGQVRRLVRGGGNTTWSPDGRWIAFNRTSSGGGISIVGSDGLHLRTLTRGDESSPQWSPDGRTILCTHEGGLVLMRPDGSGRTVMSLGAGAAAWSPDSRRIAYTVDAGPDGGGVWVVDRDGRHRRYVARDSQLQGVSWGP
jgi:TolB protein